ncbi:intermembrane transport protein PqiB [Vibrio sp. S4M6]|uniref:intermembrane transport protein PqiB n=1 Tax=Vibrio sinus TaxID=2946865 RepID=UPI002029C700|nr:intermembrane transport protein PqiB [Vibrio sinus]MCL9779827.1 intermembrane transport protein PqiB [Vibrio sinus]
MSDQHPNIESTRRFKFNTIWIVPLVAFIVSGWMIYDNWSQKGPEITITAQDAEGLEVGKTKVKSRNVDIGEVTNIQLSNDFKYAIITLQMNKGTQALLRSNTKFWVVKPRVGAEGISGLGTLLSGAYINMEPGNEGAKATKFKMLAKPPLSTVNDKGIRIRLYSTQNTKLEVGTPVHFRGYEVGYIEDVGFDIKRGAITYRLFIHAPYDALVNSNVRFWMTPGLSIKGTAKGVELRVDSLQSLITGGISFGAINEEKAAHPVKDLTQFRLFTSKQEAEDNRFNKFIYYVMLFNGSVAGIDKDTPVEYNGIQIGTVMQVPYKGASIETLENQANPAIPILVRIAPQRMEYNFSDSKLTLDDWRKKFSDAFKKGARATLNTSNLLTGAKIVDVQYIKNPKPQKVTKFGKYAVFPTTSDSFATMQDKVETILSKLAALPLNQTVAELNQTLKAATATLQQLDKVSANTNKLLANKETQQLPEKLSQSLKSLDSTLTDYQSEGVVGQKLQQSLSSLQRTLDELQPLLQEIRQKPNSLIFGKSQRSDIEPKAAQENKR